MSMFCDMTSCSLQSIGTDVSEYLAGCPEGGQSELLLKVRDYVRMYIASCRESWEAFKKLKHMSRTQLQR